MSAKFGTARKIILGIGITFASVTVLSGLSGWAFSSSQVDHSAQQREVFGGIPTALVVCFYIVIPVLLVYGAVLFDQRTKNWERGRPDNRATTPDNVKRRLRDFRAGAYMQTLLRDPAAGIMHSLIYFSFLVLLAVTTVSELNHQAPTSLKFLHGDVYAGFKVVANTAGLALLIGVVWAIVRRYVQRPYRIRIKTKPEHAVILATFLSFAVTGFLTEGYRIALDGMAPIEKWSYVGWPIAQWVQHTNHLAGWHEVWWIVHVVTFMVFLAILSTTMLRHMFTAPLNMYLRDRERPKGAMKPMPNLMETELESFGASTIEDFT